MPTYAYQSDKTYCELVHMVINTEGKYVNNPKDPGGPTKFGIALNFNQGALAQFGIHDAAGMMNLTVEQATQIYYTKYWLACGANYIPDKRLAYLHFDTAVNQGVGFSAKCVFRLSHKPAGFEANGKNEALWLRLILEYVGMRLNAYTHDRNRKTFLEGWVNRMIHIIDQDLHMQTGGVS